MRILWVLEAYDCGWYLFGSFKSLKEARHERDTYFTQPTRITKWAKVCKKDPSVGCLLLATLFAALLCCGAGVVLWAISTSVGYPVHWTTWSVFMSIALWVTVEVADQ
jgi:hypothetical protein